MNVQMPRLLDGDIGRHEALGLDIAKRSRTSSLLTLCCRRRATALTRHKVDALSDEVVIQQILLHCSVGSIQLLSMASTRYLHDTYRLASEVDVDMKDWPFALKEWQKECERKRIGFLFELELFSNIMGGPSRLPDSKTTDAELRVALGRLRPTQLRQLVVGSSLLTSSSLCWALDTFASGLQEVSVSSCGSGKLVGAEVQAALAKCPRLSSLHVEHVEMTPPAASLRRLSVGACVMKSQLWQSRPFANLQVLGFIPSTYLPGGTAEIHAWFIGIFENSPELREIDIYHCVEVTNKMLAVLMLSVPKLSKFCGCHANHLHLYPAQVEFPFSDGPRALPSGGLHPSALESFIERFPAANIFVDDVFSEMQDDL